MLAILRVSRGPDAGASRALMPGQRALVGSGNWSHFPVGDASMADPQFLIKHNRSGVHVVNVSETNSLFVNGMKTSTRKLSDGDVIGSGDCEFVVQIRGDAGHLGHLNLPLIGTIPASDLQGSGLRVTQTLEQRTGGSRITIHPDFWTDSVRMRNRGTGIPGYDLLKKIARRRLFGLLVNNRVAADAASQEGVEPSSVTALKSGENSEPQLWIIDSVRLTVVAEILAKHWATCDVMFFVPVENTQKYRERFQQSSLWLDRTVEQLTIMLMSGSLTLRESAFRFLDALLLPAPGTHPGWTLLSTVRVDSSSQTPPPDQAPEPPADPPT